MSQHLRGFRLHLVARLRALATSLDGLLLLAIAGVAGVMLWPGLAGPDGMWTLGLSSGPSPEPPVFDFAVTLLSLLLWPVLPVIAATGRATGATRGDALAQRAVPALPVGPRARMAAEVVLVLGVALATRLAWSLAGAPISETYFRDTAMGALVALPMVVAWAAPALTVPLLWVRPALTAVVLAAAARLGLLATPAALVAATLALTTVLVLSVGLRLGGRRPSARSAWAGPTSRPALPPARQLRRDFLLEPWRRLGWVIGGLVGLLVALLVAERFVTLPPFTVYVGSILVLSQLAAMAARPAGSSLFGWALTGRNGARTGDFGRAWTVLPVRPESVRRAAWLHGLVTVLVAWLGAVATVAVHNWSRTGVLTLDTPDFRIARELLLVGLIVPPMAAGLVAAATAGDRLTTALSGGSLLAVLNLPGIVLLVASQIMGRDSSVPMAVTLGLVAVLALVGTLPALRLLGRRWRPRAG